MNDAIAKPQALVDQGFHLASARLGFADDDVDVVFFESLQPVGELRRAQINQFSIDSRTPITEATGAGDDFLVEAFAPPHDGAQYHHFFAAIRSADTIENLATG